MYLQILYSLFSHAAASNLLFHWLFHTPKLKYEIMKQACWLLRNIKLNFYLIVLLFDIYSSLKRTLPYWGQDIKVYDQPLKQGYRFLSIFTQCLVQTIHIFTHSIWFRNNGFKKNWILKVSHISETYCRFWTQFYFQLHVN